MLGGKCVECGTDKDLEFDHIDPQAKLFNISTSIAINRELLLLELAKCQLLCTRCHDKKTARERRNGICKAGRQRTSKHGEVAMYTNRGCRCGECRAAWRSYMKRYMNKYREVRSKKNDQARLRYTID